MYWSDYYQNNKGLVDSIVSCESKYDPRASNPNSTAKGQWQFLDGTWQYTQEKSGIYGDVYDAKLNAQLGNYLLAQEGKQHWKECL
jgi:soluble lytic murein transglycosylase-like protein